jgi:hypothetical protein
MATPISTPMVAPIPGVPRRPGFGLEVDQILGPTSSGGGTPSSPLPFDVEIVGTSATVIPGTINGLLATNYDSVFTITNPGVYFVTLSVTATDGQLGSSTISFAASAPAAVPVVQGQPPTTFDYLLGIVVDGVWFRVIGQGSLAAAGSEVFRVSKTSPAPGTLPYDIWYTWNITAV